MYRLLIVEDDSVIRTSLKSLIDWEKYGLRLVQTAENGKVALALLQTQRVDVILSDVKMPFVNGIELLEAINTTSLHPLIYMLSAYEDFALVRKAFTLGAVDYISKSEMTEARFIAFAKQVHETLQKKAIIPERDPDPKEKDKSEEFMRILTQTTPPSSATFPFPSCLCYLILDKQKEAFKRFGPDFEKKLITPLRSTLSQVPQIQGKYSFIEEDSFHYWLYYHNGQATSSEEFTILIKKIQKTISNFMNLHVSAIVSPRLNTVADLSTAIHHGQKRKDLLLLYPFEWILHNNQAMPIYVELGNLARDIRRGNNYMASSKPFLDALDALPIDQAQQKALSLCYSLLKEFSLLDINLRELLYSSFYRDLASEIQACTTRVSLNFWLQGFFEHLWTSLKITSTDSSLGIAEKACVFIHQHYHDSSLSLTLVASAFGLNEKYFSSLFKKTIGVTFINFVTQIRMEEAQKLLSNHTLKVYEIAERVGFSSLNSFSRTYRKYWGYSPKNEKQSN